MIYGVGMCYLHVTIIYIVVH